MFNFRCRIILFLIKKVSANGCMASAKGLDVVFERPLVLEIRTTDAVPDFATVLLMGSPVSFHSKGLIAFSAEEVLYSMLSFVVGLEGSEVFEWP